MVKVSICVPAYKNPVGVERLLESIKVQSFTDYEVVVTDDSPDGLWRRLYVGQRFRG